MDRSLSTPPGKGGKDFDSGKNDVLVPTPTKFNTSELGEDYNSARWVVVEMATKHYPELLDLGDIRQVDQVPYHVGGERVLYDDYLSRLGVDLGSEIRVVELVNIFDGMHSA